MRTTVGELRKLVQEEKEYAEALNELFGKKADFGSMMKAVLMDLQNVNKKIEQAHQAAPEGAAKAVVAGMHSYIFNKIAEFRKHLEDLGAALRGAKPATEARKPGRRR